MVTNDGFVNILKKKNFLNEIEIQTKKNNVRKIFRVFGFSKKDSEILFSSSIPRIGFKAFSNNNIILLEASQKFSSKILFTNHFD